MKYRNVKGIIPDELIKELQKYAMGTYLYIPKPKGEHKQWGEKSGSREHYKKRNDEIVQKRLDGAEISDLADEYFLSVDSIKKIIINSKKT